MKSLRSVTAKAAIAALVTACSYDTTYPTPTAEPPTAANVDVIFCSFAAPRWVAVQDADGAWTPVTPQTRGTLTSYHLALTGDRAAIAVARQFGSGLTTLAVRYGLPAELSAAGDGTAAGCAESFDGTVQGNVAGLDSNEAATISVDAHAFDFVSPLQGTDFKLESVASGPQDVLAARFTHVGGATKLTGFILRHDVDVHAGVIPDIDFRSSEVFLPVSKVLTLVGQDAGASQVYGLRTGRGGDRVLSQTSAIGGSAQVLTAAPEEALGPSDLQFVVATAPPVQTNVVRAVKTYFRIATDRSLTFGPIPAPPELAIVATAPSLRVAAHFQDQPEYDQTAVINFQQGQSTVVSVAMTDRYARRAGGYRMVVPDFSSVAGFDNLWALDATRSILWTSSRIGGTVGFGVNAVPADGGILRLATDAGTITPP